MVSFIRQPKLAQAALHAPPEVAFAMRSWPLLLPTFALLILSLFLLFRLLLLTHFWETPNILANKIVFFLVIFSTFHGQRSVTAAWATRSPWSIYI